jgi:hypothetical protein
MHYPESNTTAGVGMAAAGSTTQWDIDNPIFIMDKCRHFV